jgi:hypothetical protein
MTPPLAPSPLHLVAGPGWLKLLASACIMVALGGIATALWLFATADGADFRRRRRERLTVEGALAWRNRKRPVGVRR